GGFLAIWSGVPKNMPARTAFAFVCAILTLGSGIGLLVPRTAAIASRVLLGLLVAWMLGFRLPLLLPSPTNARVWRECGETALMIGTVWLLVVHGAGGRAGFGTGGKSVLLAKALYGFGLSQFGIAHFTFLQRTVGMVPAWLPGHLGWAYFTGGSLV